MTHPKASSRNARLPFVIVCDTREQRPFDLPHSIRGTVKTGDYVLQGLEHIVVLERKSLPDLFSTVASVYRERRKCLKMGLQPDSRFERELRRMQAIKHAYVIVEATLQTVRESPPREATVHPNSLINQVLSWELAYGVHFHFAGPRRYASSLAYRLLQHAWKRYASGHAAEGAAGIDKPAAERLP